VTRATATLRRLIAEAETSRCPAQLSQLLLSLVNRGFANIGNPHNFAHPAHGAPHAIEDLVREVSGAIRLVCEAEWSEAAGFGLLQKEAFVEAATHAHGRVCRTGLELETFELETFRRQADLLPTHTLVPHLEQAALCLSGGGAVALYHLGLVHELL